MAIAPTFRRTPLKSMLDFAADREREANSIGDVITQLTQPILGGMGVQTGAPQAAVMTGPAPAPTLVQDTVSPEFMNRLFMQESGYNPNAVSPKGAIGTGQVLPSTAMDPGYGVPTIFDLADEQGVDYGGRTRAEAERLLFNDDLNQQFSTIYANAMASEFGGDPALTAAAYNAGPGAVAKYGGVPPYAETQGYVRALTGGGGDTRMGGGAGSDTLGGGMNIEDILARLYPEESPEDARRTRRQDIMAGAGDVLMGLSQGRSADISAIRAQQEQRKRQAVLDMRERERARAAASLVYSQTGDANLATGIATGAISYSDVLSERQLRRAQELADEQKIREAESAQAVADAMKGTGLFKDEDIANVAAGKLDPNTLFGIYEKAQVAEKLAEDDLNKAEVAAQNVIDAQTILSTAAPGSVEARAAERVIALGGSENVYDIIKARTPASADTKVLGPNERLVSGTGEIIATGITPAQDDKAFQFQAEIDARIQYLGEDPATAANAVLNKPDAAGYGVSVSPSGVITVTPPSAPAAVTPLGTPAAPAAPAAPAGVAGAFGQQMGTGLIGAPAAAPAAAPALPLDVATGVATLEATIAQTAQRRQELELARDTAPDDAARATAERQLAEVTLEQARLALRAAQTSEQPDAALKALAVQQAEEAVSAAELQNEKLRRELEGAEDEAATEEEKAVRRQLRALQSTDTVMREGTKLLDLTQDWKSGVIPGIIATGARLLSQTETGRAERLLAGIKDNIALDNLIALKQDSPTGGALGSVSNAEGERLENRFGQLDATGNTTDLRDNIGAAMNAYNDAIHGTPQQILALYEEGKITAEQADAYSTRLVSSLDRDTATIMTENGPATNLGLSANRDTIYGLARPLGVEEQEQDLSQEERDLYEQYKQ